MGAAAVLPAKVRDRLRWFSLTPFDQGTAEGRAQERHRRVALSAGASALSKVFAVLSTLLSIPLALNYLGTERFGIWSTLSALVITLQFADFGIGNGVINTVSAAYGAGQRDAIRRLVSSAAFTLGVIAVIILSFLPIVLPLVPWEGVFGIKGEMARQEVGSAVAAFCICVAAAIPLGLVQRVQIALQRSFIASLWQCAANACSLLAIWAATSLQMSLPWLVVALLGAPLLMAFLNSVVFFSRERDIRPSLAAVDWAATTELLHTGGSFLVLQIAVAVVFTSDSIVIAHVLGAAEVTHYAVPEKIFGFIPMILSTILAPLWPAYGEAVARRDIGWVQQSLKRSFVFACAFSLSCSILLFLLSPWLVQHWVGNSVVLSTGVLAALSLWKVLEGSGLALAMFLNGAGIIKFQLVTACLMAAAAFAIKPYLVGTWGIAGAPASTALVYLVIVLIPLAFYLPRVLHRLRARQLATI